MLTYMHINKNNWKDSLNIIHIEKPALWLVQKTLKMTDVIFLKKEVTDIAHNNSDKPQ